MGEILVKNVRAVLVTIAAVGVALLTSGRAEAHCDGMDGPVVMAAREALATGKINPVLIWVQTADELEIRRSFANTLAVRKLGPEAKELADTYFFETLVRIHRAGEGEPFTGLKPAGRDLGPAIPAADKAVESGSVQEVVKMLARASADGVRERFERVLARKNFAKDDVDAGREYVQAYVEFLHYVEGLYEAAHHGGHDKAENPYETH